MAERRAPPAWTAHAPLALLSAGVALLGGGAFLGARLSLRRAAAEEAVAGRAAGAPPAAATVRGALRAAGLPLSALAARAFLYGTLLCAAGGAAAAAAAAWALDVRSLQAFSDRLKTLGPGARASLAGAVVPALGAVEAGGRAAARAADGSVGAAVRAVAPRVDAGARDDLAGLSASDRAALAEFTAWLTGGAAAADGGEGGAPPPPPPRRARAGIRVE
jgi:hypothetical protein